MTPLSLRPHTSGHLNALCDMSLRGESMLAHPIKRILMPLVVAVWVSGTLVLPLLIVDFIDRLEWRDYEYDRGGTCETVQCGNVRGARVDTNLWP